MQKNNLLIYRKKKPEFNSIENVFNALLPFLKVNKIELPFISQGIKNRLKNIAFIKRYNAKIYHITGNDHYLIFGLLKRKTILTIHDIEVLNRNIGFKRFLLKKIWFDYPIKYAKTVTTISEFSKQEILNLNHYKTPIKVIHNPLTLSITYTPKPFNEKCPTILHLGTKENKNLTRLIEAINNINCELTIIGEPKKHDLDLLKEYAIPYTIKVNLSNSQIIKEYEECDMLSFVSTYEGFGLPIIEAQAMGRPVLASNIASIPEVAGEGAKFVDPFNIESVKNGITEIINSSDLRNVLIQKGLENVNRFDPKNIARQYQDIYNAI